MRHSNTPLSFALLGSILTAFQFGTAVQGQQPEAQRRASEAVVATASSGSPIDFAYALGEAGVSAGVVVDAASFHRPRLDRPLAPRLAGRRAAVVDADAVSKLFAASRRDYAVSVDREVVLLHHADGKDDAFLGQKRGDIEATNVTIDDAIVAVIRSIDPSIPKIGGTVGSWLSRPEEPAPTAEMLRGPLVSLFLTAPTPVEALNDIARQAPGTVWVLVRHAGQNGTHYTLAVRRPNQQMSEYPFPLK